MVKLIRRRGVKWWRFFLNYIKAHNYTLRLFISASLFFSLCTSTSLMEDWWLTVWGIDERTKSSYSYGLIDSICIHFDVSMANIDYINFTVYQIWPLNWFCKWTEKAINPVQWMQHIHWLSFFQRTVWYFARWNFSCSLGRVVKATDSKSVGLCPRRFESCRLRDIFRILFYQRSLSILFRTRKKSSTWSGDHKWISIDAFSS